MESFGNLIFTTVSYPGNTGHLMFDILSHPGNIGNLIFLISHILEILEIEVCNILYNLEIRAAGGRLQGLCCAALDYFWNMIPGISGYPGNIGNLFFLYFGIFQKKTCAEISRRMHRSMGRDLSYETDSGPKTKTVSDPNFQLTATAAAATTTATTSQQLSHLARALSITPRDQISRSGSIPHFDHII